MQLADFDGDGEADAFYPGPDGWLVAWSADGHFAEWKTGVFTDRAVDQYGFGDFDGDGMTDVFFMDDRDWWIAYSNGREAPTWVQVRTDLDAVVEGIEQLGFGNVTNSAGGPTPTTDILWFSGSTSGWGYWRSTGERGLGAFDGRYTRRTGLRTGFERDAYALQDFDADGIVDVFYADGQAWHIAYSALGWVEARSDINKPLDAVGFGHFSDAPNAGLLDPIWFTGSTESGWRYWRGQGGQAHDDAFAGYFALDDGTYTQFDKQDYCIGDVDGDGHSELLYSGGASLWMWDAGVWSVRMSAPRFDGVVLSDSVAQGLVPAGEVLGEWAVCLQEGTEVPQEGCIVLTTGDAIDSSVYRTRVVHDTRPTGVPNTLNGYLIAWQIDGQLTPTSTSVTAHEVHRAAAVDALGVATFPVLYAVEMTANDDASYTVLMTNADGEVVVDEAGLSAVLRTDSSASDEATCQAVGTAIGIATGFAAGYVGKHLSNPGALVGLYGNVMLYSGGNAVVAGVVTGAAFAVGRVLSTRVGTRFVSRAASTLSKAACMALMDDESPGGGGGGGGTGQIPGQDVVVIGDPRAPEEPSLDCIPVIASTGSAYEAVGHCCWDQAGSLHASSHDECPSSPSGHL